MMNKYFSKLTKLEMVIYTALLVFIGYGLYLFYFTADPTRAMFKHYVREDGTVENLTSIFLFASSVVCIIKAISLKKQKKAGTWILTAAVLAVLFFFAAGEEISWGQRIFGIQSSEFFLEHNKQAETNLHNLIVDGTNINKLIFSQLLFVVMIIYFLFSRLLIRKVGFVNKLQVMFNVPLPRTSHVVAMLVSAGLIALITVAKNAELLELAFAMIFFVIFMNPLEQLPLEKKKDSK